MSQSNNFTALQPTICVRIPEDTTGAEECSAWWKQTQQALFSSILAKDRYWRDGLNIGKTEKVLYILSKIAHALHQTAQIEKGNYHNQYKLFTDFLTLDVTENRDADLLEPD